MQSTVQSSQKLCCNRRAAVLFLALLLAACSADREPARPNPRDLSASAFFREREDTIEVRGFGRWPLEQAELISPDGGVMTALDIRNDRTAGETGLRPSVGIGGSGGSRSGSDVGVGISFPILGGASTPDTIASRASFPIVDMPTYRATWRLWRVNLRFAEGEGRSRHLELPAPEPPSSNERSR